MRIPDNQRVRGPLRMIVLLRHIRQFGLICSYCRLPIVDYPEVDHIISRKKRPDLSRQLCNLTVSCHDCNKRKNGSQINVPDRIYNLVFSMSLSQDDIEHCKRIARQTRVTKERIKLLYAIA